MKRKTLVTLLIITTILVSTLALTASTDPTRYTIDTIDSLKDIIINDYYKEVDEDTIIKGAIDGMFKALDPNSNYMDSEEFQDFLGHTDGEFGGIGVSIERKDDRITVVSPIEDTPAHQAGLGTGDIIISVDDTDIKDYPLDKAVTLIKGEVGSKVKLGIIKANTQETVYIELERAIIKIESIKTETPYGKKAKDEIKDKTIGYIRITEFNDNTYRDFKTLLEQYKKEGKKGLIIDLRNNPGGLLDSVIKICKEIIPEGPIVHIDAKGVKNDKTHYSKLKNPPFKIAVITNGGSASASEILTGAVKDSKIGIAVGTKTYGKGTVQNLMFLTNGAGVKLTIAEYMTRDKTHIDGKGIKPDIQVEAEMPQETHTDIKPHREIYKGNLGIDIYAIQEKLKNLGHQLKLDGIMGDQTIKLVNQLLKEKDLPQVKYLDIKTQETINEIYYEEIINRLKDNQLETAIKELQKLL